MKLMKVQLYLAKSEVYHLREFPGRNFLLCGRSGFNMVRGSGESQRLCKGCELAVKRLDESTEIIE